MTDLPPRAGDGAEEALLLARARAGDSEAFGDLYVREFDAARRLARILVGTERAEELVAESFARVLAQLKAGRGPTEDFRAYLQVTIRNGYRDAHRAMTEAPSSDQPWLLDDVLPPVEELVEDLDRDVAVTALATLPKAWQQVLWHLEVEGRKPAEVAGLLDMEPGAVSSLAYRAREGLKRAYLDQHFEAATGGQCGWTQSRMSQYVRGDLSPRAQQKVADHLDACSACSAAYAEVDRVNKKLAAWLFPVVLWGIASADKGGLLWFAGAAGAGGAGAAGVSGGSGGSAGSGGGAASSGATASNAVVLGAAAFALACAVAGGVTLVRMAGDDKPRDTTSADAPAGPQRSPSGGPRHKPPKNKPPKDKPTDGAEPVVDTPTGVTTPASTEPTTDPSEPPTTEPPPTEPPTTEPPPTEPPPTEPPPTEPPVSPHLTGMNARRSGLPLVGPWNMGLNVVAGDPAPVTIKVEYRFSGLVLLLGRSGAGWQCDGTISAVNPLDGPLDCTYAYTGGPVPEVTINVVSVVTARPTGPPATVTLYVDGKAVDTGSF